MPSRFFRLPTARLSRRIVLWIFASVIAIETIIFIPSFKNREKELLAQLTAVSRAKVTLLMQFSEHLESDAQLLKLLERLRPQSVIMGGIVYDSGGRIIGQFGEVPDLTYADVHARKRFENLYAGGNRYDIACTEFSGARDYTLVLRHDASSVRKGLLAFILRIGGLVVIISFFVTAGAWLALGPIVVTPVLRLRLDLIEAGEAFSQDRPVPQFKLPADRRRDELGDVMAAFLRMVEQIADAISQRKTAEAALHASLKQVEAYSRVLDQELENGRAIQANFFPKNLPQLPGLEMAAYFKPARQVAGDFYDAFWLPGQQLGLVVADVCDKGVGAALFMALFRSLIRIFSGQTTLDDLNRAITADSLTGLPAGAACFVEPPDPLDALNAVQLANNYIALNHADLSMFATLFFGILDPRNGQLRYVNGGHEPLFIVGASGGVRETLNATGPVVGVEAGMDFKICQTDLRPGDILLGYTDGIPEASNPAGDFFTPQKLLTLLENKPVSARP